MLRAGGYFAWAAQPVYKHELVLEEQWEGIRMPLKFGMFKFFVTFFPSNIVHKSHFTSLSLGQ